GRRTTFIIQQRAMQFIFSTRGPRGFPMIQIRKPTQIGLSLFAALFAAMACPAWAGGESDSASASPASGGNVGAATTATPVTTTPPKKTWKDTMFFGGGIGMGFGDVDYVSVEPLVGWHVHPKIAVGVSPLYRWTNDSRYPDSVSTSDYGIRGFLQYYPVPNFF